MINLTLFCISVLLNAVLGLVLGSFISWLFRSSISTGLEVVGLLIPVSKIHNLGALFGTAIGFMAPFYRFPLLIKLREN